MGFKLVVQPPQSTYRDDPDRDDAASASSAVLMEDVEHPDSDLPAYEDVPSAVRPVRPVDLDTRSYVDLLSGLSSPLMLLLNVSIKIPHPPRPS